MSLNEDIIKVKKLFEDGPIFKAASPEQINNRDRFSKPIMLPREVKEAIIKVLEYSYHDERLNYYEGEEADGGPSNSSDHIYNIFV